MFLVPVPTCYHKLFLLPFQSQICGWFQSLWLYTEQNKRETMKSIVSSNWEATDRGPVSVTSLLRQVPAHPKLKQLLKVRTIAEPKLRSRYWVTHAAWTTTNNLMSLGCTCKNLLSFCLTADNHWIMFLFFYTWQNYLLALQYTEGTGLNLWP